MNPFTPGFGTSPEVLVGREQLLAQIGRAFGGRFDAHRTTWLQGKRGAGKTVLLNEIQDQAASAGWAVVQEDGQSAGSLSARLTDRIARDVLPPERRRVRGASVTSPVGGAAVEFVDPEGAETTLRDAMSAVLDQPTPPEGLLITVDEIHAAPAEEVAYVGNAVQHLIRQDRPLAMIVAGLPQPEDDRATFLGRCVKPELEQLHPDEVRLGLQKTAAVGGGRFEGRALDLAVTVTAGYPYMLQLVGYWSWEGSNDGRIEPAAVTGALERCDRELAGAVSGVDVTLTDVESRFLLAMAEDDGPTSTADIGRRLERSAQYVGKYRARLIDRGVIHAVGTGLVDFSIPGHRARVRLRALLSGELDPTGPDVDG